MEKEDEEKERKKTDQDAHQHGQEWSRHYDQLQWVVITIFSAGVGALLAASFDDKNAEELWPESAGLLLTVMGVYYVATFRFFRSRLHHELLQEGKLKDFLQDTTPRWPHMWHMFVGSFTVVGVKLLFNLYEKCVHPWVMVFVGTVWLGVLGALWNKGRSQVSKRPSVAVECQDAANCKKAPRD